MERMTVWNGTKWTIPKGTTRGMWRRVIERLAAYEDTGYEPSEIAPKTRPIQVPKRMTVRKFIDCDFDIDVADDVCESLYIAFVGPLKLTAQGEIEFAAALDLEIEVGDDVAIVHVDHPEERIWRRNLSEAKHFFESAAGLCSVSDYDKWFVQS